jgi:thiol-disulfide isomerase/thioredoxin
MPNANKILIEVMYKADYCLPCFYMDQTVLEVLAKYADSIEYQRVDFLRGE